MPRAIPPDRFEMLLDVAARVFIEQGYRRTQMADIAARMGVAKGTVYLYVAGKEALLHEALRHADHLEPVPLPEVLPVATPAREETLAMIRSRVATAAGLPALERALRRQRVRDIAAELEEVLTETYELLARHRTAIRLFDACAADRPEIARVWYDIGRRGVAGGLDAYLRERTRRGRLCRFPDAAVASRLVIETLTFWAVHRHWDPSPEPFDETSARQTAIAFLVSALAPAG